jgi:DNA polymerase I-like protein with 3'-5' exonuclease and polymerase domains
MPKIAVISDYPTVEEVGAPYQGGASMQMKNSLKSAFAMMDSSLGRKEVGYFYLSPVRFQQGLDTEVFSTKELPKEVRKDFNCIEYLPETYISDTLNDYLTPLLRDLREFQPDIIVCSGKWSLYFFGCYTLSDKNIGKISSVKGTKRAYSTFGLNMKFRGSLLKVYDALDLGQVVCIPIIPHAYQFQITASKAIQHDYLKIAWTFEKIKSDGNKDYFLNYAPDTTVFKEFEEARVFLTKLLNRLNKGILELSVDLETVGKTIDTIGYAFDEHKGYAIPFLRAVTKKTKKYKDVAYDKKGKEVQIFLGSTTRTFERVFSCFEESIIVHLNKKILTHPNARLIGQNFHYDCLIFQDTWEIEVHAWVDTLVLAHCLRNTDKKGLAYLCSLYLERYAYWKDDLNATNSIDRWHYCAKDSLFTFALKNCLVDELSTRDLQNQAYYWNKQIRTAKNVLRRMFDGLTVDIDVRRKQDEEFSALFESAINQIQLLVGYPVNIRSTPQMRKLLIDVLGIEPVLDRKRKTPTFGNAAMLKYCVRYPEYAYLLYLILEAKSIATYLQNFIKARLDEEGKLRSFIGVAGTKSNRFSSKKFLNGVGANVMNWSTGKNSLVYTVMAIEHAASESDYSPEEEEEEDSDVLALAQQESKLALVPNSKMIIIPSRSDLKFVNVDLSSGDLYYVTWMADAKFNKEILGNGGDVYTVIGSKYFNVKLEKKDPRRQTFKKVCHSLHYLGMPKTIALLCGLSEIEVLRIQDFYFNQNPEIVEYYQNKIINDCLTLGYTTNIFGARYYCETTDEKRCKTWRQQMVALPAQGSVADVINEVMDRACEGERGENFKLQTNLFLPQTYKDAQAHSGLLLPQEYPMKDKLQIHDAGLWEVHKNDTTYKERINEYFKVELPFTDRWGKPSPLIIPWDISESEVSYAGCK